MLGPHLKTRPYQIRLDLPSFVWNESEGLGHRNSTEAKNTQGKKHSGSQQQE